MPSITAAALPRCQSGQDPPAISPLLSPTAESNL